MTLLEKRENAITKSRREKIDKQISELHVRSNNVEKLKGFKNGDFVIATSEILLEGTKSEYYRTYVGPLAHVESDTISFSKAVVTCLYSSGESNVHINKYGFGIGGNMPIKTIEKI